VISPEIRALEVAGRYADLLRASLELRNRAAIEGRPDQEAAGSVAAARACRRIGRCAEVLVHAARAAELAPAAGLPGLPALARHAHAGGLRGARRYDEALAALQEALAALPEGHDALRAEILLDTAETALEAGARRDAETALGRGGALVQWLRDPLLLSWSLYLRSQLEADAPGDLQLAAAYEIAKKAACPELQWQILWRLSERAEARGSPQMRDDLAWAAHGILSKLAETLEPEDATAFWRQGPRRVFLDQVQRRCGPSFLKMVMLGGPAGPDPSDVLVRGFGFDPASVSAFLAQLS
jgi:tetratricopeptide (TPR) repeat protein